jgi:hypothetical protein
MMMYVPGVKMSRCIRYIYIYDRMVILIDTERTWNYSLYTLKANETANRINRSINTISGYGIAERNGIPMLSELALTRFYRDEGKFSEEAARNTNETKVKLDYERGSSIAYRKGGMPSEASRMEFKSRRNKRIYERDMKRASEYIDAARVQLDNAIKPLPIFFGSNFMGILKG